MADRTQSAADACSPVFVFVSTFRRNSADSAMTVQELHDKLEIVLARVEADFGRDEQLAKLWSRVRYPLVVTIDQVIINSRWKWSTAWWSQPANLLEHRKFESMDGGKRFWVLVDELLREQGKQVPELAEFFFRCVAFGFRGELHGRDREIEARKQQLYEKARLPIEPSEQICPQAYGKNAARPMVKHPTVGVARLVIVCAGVLVLVWLGADAMARSFEQRVALGATRLERTIEAARGVQPSAPRDAR